MLGNSKADSPKPNLAGLLESWRPQDFFFNELEIQDLKIEIKTNQTPPPPHHRGCSAKGPPRGRGGPITPALPGWLFSLLIQAYRGILNSVGTPTGP